MRDKRLAWKRFVLAVLPIAFALLAIIFPNLSERKLDNSILVMIVLAILVVVLPWERLTSFKAAGVELELDRPQIDKAIGDLGVLKGKENVSDENLKGLLGHLVPQIEKASGFPELSQLAASGFAGKQWMVRAPAKHARSKTFTSIDTA